MSGSIELKAGPLCHFLCTKDAAPAFYSLTKGGRGDQHKRRGGGQGHVSSLPGPEPCCWLHGSLSQPRTKISLDTASDRLAPAALAGRRRRTQTHRERAVISPLQPVSSTSQTADFFQPGCLPWSPPTATGPWGPAKGPRTLSALDCAAAESLLIRWSPLPSQSLPPEFPGNVPFAWPSPRRVSSFVCTHS